MPPRAKLKIGQDSPAQQPTTSTIRTTPEQSNRRGKKILSGYFPKSTWAAVRHLAADLEKTSQELLEEAITDLLHKHGRTP